MTFLLLAFALQPNPGLRAPDRARSITMVEAAIRASLKDPDSAKFSWADRLVFGSYRPALGRRSHGWVICGTINARNSYGGYSGQYAAIGVVDGVENTVETVDIDQPSRWSAHAGWVADQCRKNGVPVL